MFWRLHAQRLLVERGQKDVVPQLVALVRNKSVDEVGTNGGALHALWTLQGLGETANARRRRLQGGGRGAEASGRGRAQGGGDGAAEDAGGGERDRQPPACSPTPTCTPASPRC